MVALTHTYHQVPLSHFVELDDLFLHDQVALLVPMNFVLF
jgi:hypothetical protein